MHDTVLRCVLVGFVHPAAIAAVVVSVTIEELLHGEAGDVTELARDVGKGFKGTGRCEGPAGPAGRLILGFTNSTVLKPVNALSNLSGLEGSN